jgi:formylmethanofuran dehydrogenase subunit C
MSSDRITLSLRAVPDGGMDVDGVTPDRCAALTNREIAGLPVWLGARQAHLGDFFDVRGERSDRVRIEGDVVRVHGLGAGMASGELVIAGHAGCRTAAGMRGGRIHVLGNVADDAGSGMSGGVLRVGGNAGDRLAAALPGASRGMTGGEVIVSGAAGRDTAARARRGLVVVGGDCGEAAGRAMIAGTLLVFGRTGPHPGRGSKRGSIVAAGGITVPSSYRYACTFQPPHVRLTVTYLARRYGLEIADAVRDGLYRRYCGDAGDPGKGEILELVTSG